MDTYCMCASSLLRRRLRRMTTLYRRRRRIFSTSCWQQAGRSEFLAFSLYFAVRFVRGSDLAAATGDQGAESGGVWRKCESIAHLCTPTTTFARKTEDERTSRRVSLQDLWRSLGCPCLETSMFETSLGVYKFDVLFFVEWLSCGCTCSVPHLVLGFQCASFRQFTLDP